MASSAADVHLPVPCVEARAEEREEEPTDALSQSTWEADDRPSGEAGRARLEAGREEAEQWLPPTLLAPQLASSGSCSCSGCSSPSRSSQSRPRLLARSGGLEAPPDTERTDTVDAVSSAGTWTNAGHASDGTGTGSEAREGSSVTARERPARKEATTPSQAPPAAAPEEEEDDDDDADEAQRARNPFIMSWAALRSRSWTKAWGMPASAGAPAGGADGRTSVMMGEVELGSQRATKASTAATSQCEGTLCRSTHLCGLVRTSKPPDITTLAPHCTRTCARWEPVVALGRIQTRHTPASASKAERRGLIGLWEEATPSCPQALWKSPREGGASAKACLAARRDWDSEAEQRAASPLPAPAARGGQASGSEDARGGDEGEECSSADADTPAAGPAASSRPTVTQSSAEPPPKQV
mmetsp:Transcript_17989/g.67872  ORF Transcript_17989/g.67872 Transcript_17989/m.67872 type:complete len:413 (-) Transcript_17989:652-1890(-)